MDVHWSPRKRIKLNPDASGSDRKENIVAQMKVDKSSQSQISPAGRPGAKPPIRRVSTDFAKELDELLEKPEGTFNPTQVFLVDDDVELAMLRADMEHQSMQPLIKSTLSRTLSEAATNVHPPLDVKRQVSDVWMKPASSFTPTTSQIVDDLEGIDINELTAVIQSAENIFSKNGAQVSTQECTQRSALPHSPPQTDLLSSRCVVEVVPLYSTDSNGVGLRVLEQETGKQRFITLTGVWLASYIEDPWQIVPGDVVHILVVGKRWEADHIVIGDSEELFPDIIVFHPDAVISSTTLSASATCHRRSVIQNRVLAPSIGPAPTDPDEITRSLSPIIGNCVHEAVQAAATVNNFSEAYLLEAGEKAMKQMMLPGIWACGSVPSAVTNQLRSRLSSISRWGIGQWPKIASKLRECEAEIRPKSLGVTGKLDMDIEDTAGARSCIEIKTGKHHAIHVGQVVLYYLLQYVDKHGNPNTEFAAALPTEISKEYLLLYLPAQGEAETIRVKITARESQNIMRNRNLVASHAVKKTLPPPILKKGDCQFCPTRTECAGHYLEKSEGEDAEVFKRFLAATCFQKRTSTALCEKSSVVAYENTWMRWIDSQPTVEALGGLSAARRMRGNLLHMVASCLFKENGPHEGSEAAFFNWMPLLSGTSSSATSSMGKKCLCEYLSGYNPRNRVGRAICVVSSLDEREASLRLVAEVVSPLLLQQERILLCGTSHASVDNILRALLSAGLSGELLSRVTRLASKPDDVAEGVRDRMLLPQDWSENIGQLEQSRLMFACSVKAVHHDILSRGDFNLAIVVDAQRVSDPALWAVLLRARQVLLFGPEPSSETDSPAVLFQRLLKAGTCPIEKWEKPSDVVILDD